MTTSLQKWQNHISHQRALSICGAALSGIGKSLTPLRLSGTDGINQLFDYRITLQTPVEAILAVLNNYAFVVDKRLIDTYGI